MNDKAANVCALADCNGTAFKHANKRLAVARLAERDEAQRENHDGETDVPVIPLFEDREVSKI